MARDVQALKTGQESEREVELHTFLPLEELISGTDSITGKSRSVTGSAFIVGHSVRGDLGSGTNQADPQTYLAAAGYNNFGSYTSGVFAVV